MKLYFQTTLIFLMVFTFKPIFACSCLQQDLAERFKETTHIFTAKLSSATVISPKNKEEWPYIEGSFKVIDVFKGNATSIIKLRSGMGDGDCGVPMIVGKKYVIFQNNNNFISTCSGTKTINSYFDDVLTKKYRDLASQNK